LVLSGGGRGEGEWRSTGPCPGWDRGQGGKGGGPATVSARFVLEVMDRVFP